MEINPKIKDVVLSSYIFNASGPSDTTLEELNLIWSSRAWAITMKSATLEAREWNPEPRYAPTSYWSINSMWLPNLWYEKYVGFSSDLKMFEKPIIASIAWLKPDDFIVMTKAFQNSDADLIELNMSCPNVPWKPQIWYDFDTVEYILKNVDNLWNKPIWIKLPPYFDFAHYDQIAEIILRHNVSFITCINSIWNTLIIDSETETTLIRPKWWFGWLWGDFVKPIALANVRRFYELFWDNVFIIWCGWIKNWTDAFEFLLAWAWAIQLWTVFEKEGPECFGRIEKELAEILNRKWYNSIDEVRGRLKII
ncbi:MAG: hypothetical protein ACD_3C00013G0001 [uncultured bacterium (gcode 4)]|uniref:Dihydroorotate dehydrogenase catalytic domain-containing protein n=1 Tax=uncultured bacterium (gcode 4) TaxID=1234023 RepID=K2G0L3_9BACT|nr:MAG: hypothetical protein ACD_3C00013G0001 [uncultured bacterium (gcode 4)]